MFSIASWNIRGLNHSPKQKEVRQVADENNLSVCAILESYVDVAAIYDTCKKVCNMWKWTSNESLCSKGSQIILGWNDDLVDVMIMAQTNQDGFREIVESGWSANVEGYAMYRVVKRLKGLKSPFCAFVSHYNQFLGAEGVTNLLDDHDIYIRTLDNAKADLMVRNVTEEEVKSVIFSMGDDKALGPNDFTATFFKKAWDVVGGDISCATRDFFSNGKLLKELNHTIIALIPKVTTPARINDYRPISCYNVLYKCISKIIADRVKEGLVDIVSINQSAFVPGRRISDNILLTQELMRNYYRSRGPPRCALKFDVQKAYDIGKRGLRQGDPLSPYLFTLVMEVLTLMLQRRVHNSVEFQYHHLCEQQRIINLCFVDDLFLFARGHPSSVSIIMDALDEFKQVSGMVPSIPKSTPFFCNVHNAIKTSILNSMPFAEGEMKKGKAKVAWDSVCMPKHKDGLGIRIIDDFNVALMTTNIWCILTHKESLWVKWVHTWDDVCPLKDMLSNRDIARSGFSLNDSVPFLIDDIDNVILWRGRDGVLRPFSVWSKVRVLCGMNFVSPRLMDVSAFIVPISKGRTVVSILSWIVVAATSYYIWLERNTRLFKKKISSPDQIVEVIYPWCG
ncbi:sodium/hydrogen exchanger 6 [Tanacetum coccineum]|uniref:Sodium/hydrogen exchanger 6 n=1 Tax=Tanacetum coccineum TaxID=301880 RepID=A0ABQ5GQF7_9ASTR